MTPNDFVYWLQGFMEIANPTKLDAAQTQVIKDHLSLVLNKVTPDRATSGAVWIGPRPNPLDEFLKNPRVTCSNDNSSAAFPNLSLGMEPPASC
jgi:hypothetical protein